MCWQPYGFTCKGRVKQKNYNRNRKTHLELASNCVLFFLLCVYYSHRTDSAPFVTLIWKAERTEKALSRLQNNPSIQWETQPNICFLINGPWMHKTLPLSWHLRTWKEFIQACFSKKHDINISLEADSRITFHVCLYINQYSLQFNPYSKFYFLSNQKTHYGKKREIEMQRNLWSKSVLTKEKMQWRDIRKSFIT